MGDCFGGTKSIKCRGLLGNFSHDQRLQVFPLTSIRKPEQGYRQATFWRKKTLHGSILVMEKRWSITSSSNCYITLQAFFLDFKSTKGSTSENFISQERRKAKIEARTSYYSEKKEKASSQGCFCILLAQKYFSINAVTFYQSLLSTDELDDNYGNSVGKKSFCRKMQIQACYTP